MRVACLIGQQSQLRAHSRSGMNPRLSVRPSVRLCGYAGWLGANAAFAETFGQTVQLCIYVFMMFFFAVYSTLTLHCFVLSQALMLWFVLLYASPLVSKRFLESPD